MEKENILMSNMYKRKKTKKIYRYKWVYENFFKNTKNKKILEIGMGVGGLYNS